MPFISWQKKSTLLFEITESAVDEAQLNHRGKKKGIIKTLVHYLSQHVIKRHVDILSAVSTFWI